MCSQADLVTRPSSHLIIIIFFCPTDQPTFMRGRVIGNETFYEDGLTLLFDVVIQLVVNKLILMTIYGHLEIGYGVL